MSQNGDVIEALFQGFDEKLREEGLITHKGTIIDASFVDVPRQRNSCEENQSIKNGRIPEDWTSQDNAAKLAQKDTDARWAKKNNETHYGYKDHVKCDAESKLITAFGVTAASVHDSNMCLDLIDDEDEAVYADSAYSSTDIEEGLPEGCVSRICEKGVKNHPLTTEQMDANREKSKTRCRIEHVFGFMTNSLGGINIRSIGFDRAWVNIGLMNITYNLCRYAFLKRSARR